MWYIASAFFRADHLGPRPNSSPLWEERLFLIDAADDETATLRAEETGRASEHEYEVSRPTPHMLRWTFVKVERVQLVEGLLVDGTEIFSRFLRAAEAESLLRPFDDAEDVEKA